ncbi:MAG: right-handed parallel beta-helix repeat-containing protein [Treponema sp.]|nr:right-handed parallel beta-helix repeat-containing protein [Treponema sp.]
MKKRFLRLFFTLFALSLLSQMFVSCTQDKTFPEYLKDYTEEAGVGYFRIEQDTSVDKYGNTCVNSSEDLNIHLFLFNPQGFELIWNYFSESGLNPAFCSLNDSNTEFSMIIKSDVLKAYDSGLKTITVDEDISITRDLGGKISLSTIVDELERNFTNPYTLKKVVVNSTPGKIKGAKFQSSSDQKYVVCFNVPVIKGTVHEYDTHTVYIGSNKWTFDGNFENILPASGATGTLTTTAPTGMTALDGTDSDFVKEGSGYFQAYYITNIPVADDASEIKYLIKIEDDDGLKTEFNISNKAKTLSSPFVTLENMTADSETGYWILELSHSGKTEVENGSSVNCGMPVINYTIKQNGTVFKQGKGTAPVKVELPAATNYTCEAFATKDYYIDSEPMTSENFTVNRSNKYYVKNSGNDDWPGSRNKPYKTLKKVMEDILEVNTDFSEIELYFLTDIKLNEDEKYNASDDCFCPFPQERTIKIEGVGDKRTIDANNLCQIFNFNNSTVTLKNLVFTNVGGDSLLKQFTAVSYSLNQDTYTGNIEISNCDFISNNSGSKNGGCLYIYNSSGSVDKITNCNFESNDGGNGGALYLATSIDVSNCDFIENRTHSGSDGGAVFIDSATAVVNFTDCQFISNISGYYGGAVSLENDNMVTFKNCDFIKNDAAKNGGAINLAYRNEIITKATIDSCSFDENITYRNGGAVSVDNSQNQLIVKGKITATTNKNATTNKPDNFYLASGAKLTIGDSLKDSLIGISTENRPSVGYPVEFTTGFAAKNPSIYPSVVFKSDSSYGIAWNDDKTDAVLAVSGGGISEGIYGNLTFSIDKTSMTQGTETKFTITCNRVPEIPLEDFTFSYKLKLMDEEVSSDKYKTSASDISLARNEFVIRNNLLAGNYILTVTITYKGKEYPADFNIYITL